VLNKPPALSRRSPGGDTKFEVASFLDWMVSGCAIWVGQYSHSETTIEY
jgi:hypothetical protein